MKLNEFFAYLADPATQTRTRVVLLPPDNWTNVQQVLRERGCSEVRLSEVVTENAWLPTPDEVFGRIRESGVLLGLDGYLALLDEQGRRHAMEAVKRWVDDDTAPPLTVLMKNSVTNRTLVRDVFNNPRYCMGRLVIKVIGREDTGSETCSEIVLVGDEWKEFLPQQTETFQSFLHQSEERAYAQGSIRIVVQSEGRRLAGVSAEVRQVTNLRDFADTFYRISEAWLSDEALKWLMREKQAERNIFATLFPNGQMEKCILRVFGDRTGTEREAVLWAARQIARAGSYLESIVREEAVTPTTFQSAYISSPPMLSASVDFIDERRIAISELGTERAEADIRKFIARHTETTTALLAPWLNCGTKAERADLLRRCAMDGFVSYAVRAVYPELDAYLGDRTDNAYFATYRVQKLCDQNTPIVSDAPVGTHTSRDSLLQGYSVDSTCALLVVDAMGAEWLPMLLNLARTRNIGVESARIAEAQLPTATRFNVLAWPSERRLPDIKRFDNIVHNGAEAHELHSVEENLAEQLEVIGSDVLPKVADALTRFERVIVTADHGSSRLAARPIRTLAAPEGAEIVDSRYCRKGSKHCPPELEETLKGEYWVVRGYDRLPKQGGGNGFERHGGGTPEERLVPLVVFSREGTFVAPQTAIPTDEITENEAFDL